MRSDRGIHLLRVEAGAPECDALNKVQQPCMEGSAAKCHNIMSHPYLKSFGSSSAAGPTLLSTTWQLNEAVSHDHSDECWHSNK